MTDEQPPNCDTCPAKYIHHNSGMGTDRPRCRTTGWFLDTDIFHTLKEDYFSKSVCPLHPDAKAWMMRDVIEKLEDRDQTMFNCGIKRLMPIQEAIALIKGDGK